MPDDPNAAEALPPRAVYARFRLTVPSPKAWFHLGEPSDLGYRGVSLGADDHAFLSVKGSTLTQAKGQVTHVAWLEWMQASGGDMTINSGAHQMMGTKLQLVLAAGAGYAPDLQLEDGIDVPKSQFNPYDYKEILEPCANGVRDFDGDLADAFNEFLEQSGVTLPAGASTGPLAALAAAAGKKAWLLKLLMGIPADPTENSESIEQFARKHGGLLGQLARVRAVADRLERWTSRPETLPFAGPVIGAIKALQPVIQGVTAAAAAFSVTDPHAQRASVSADYRREMGEAEGKGALIGQGLGARSWADKGTAVSELAGTGFQHLLRPLANRVRALTYVLNDVRTAVEAIAGVLGGPPPTSSLALVGKDGVSLISPKRVFGYAADGFHFVTSKPVKSVPTGLDALLGKVQDLSDKLLGPPKPVPMPGFHVRSQGDVDFRSQRDVNVWAVDPQSRARVTSGFAAELSAMHAAGISARMGTAEVLGKNVVLGSKPARAKGAAAIVLAGAAVDAADDAFEACVRQIHKTEKELKEKAEKLRKAMLREDGISLLMKPAKRADATTLTAAIDVLELEHEAKTKALRGLQAALNAAYKTYEAALAAAPLESPLAKAMDWDGKQVQAIAENIEMASAEKVDVFSKEVSVASTGSIKLQAEPPLPGLPGKGTVTVTSNQVEINVADRFKVVVSESGVSIQAAGQTVLKTDGVTATLEIGGSSVKLTATGLDLAGLTTSVTGEMINLG